MSRSPRRFYKEVAVAQAPESGGTRFTILLDGKAVKTPSGRLHALPNAALAEAVAAEWRAQADVVRPEAMPLTRLANTAIDRMPEMRPAAVEQILALARQDVVCYRARSPQELVKLEEAAWDPLVAWAGQRLGIALTPTAGLEFAEQSPDALAALAQLLAVEDDFSLTALHAAATLLGSAIIALALFLGHLDAAAAFAAAHVEETYQASRWGRDAEAEQRSRIRLRELEAISRFLNLVRGATMGRQPMQEPRP